MTVPVYVVRYRYGMHMVYRGMFRAPHNGTIMTPHADTAKTIRNRATKAGYDVQPGIYSTREAEDFLSNKVSPQIKCCPGCYAIAIAQKWRCDYCGHEWRKRK